MPATSFVSNPQLRADLLSMAQEDLRVRTELAADGSLYDGYHPRMELVHRRNANRLAEILEEHGWPGRTLVGADAAHAAWLIAQHAIGEPTLQRRALELIRSAAGHGEAELLEVAMLEDRVRIAEGKPQRYGTQFDWDESGTMSPLPVDDPEHVNERRRAVGLNSIEEQTAAKQREAVADGETAPANYFARQRALDAWYRARGWR